MPTFRAPRGSWESAQRELEPRSVGVPAASSLGTGQMNWASEARTLGFLLTWCLKKGKLRHRFTTWEMGCGWSRKAEGTPARGGGNRYLS